MSLHYTYCEFEVICGNCGVKQQQNYLTSAYSITLPDLDSRPSEYKRSTMQYWIQQCNQCKYCNGDISTKTTQDQKEFIKTTEYQQLLLDNQFPQLANQFICNARLKQIQNMYGAAGWQYLRAAWVCDDKNTNKDYTIKCRQMAFDCFLMAKEKNQQFIQQTDMCEEIVMADILRRMENFNKAQQYCQLGLEKCENEKLKKIFNFLNKQCQQKNVEIITIGEALK